MALHEKADFERILVVNRAKEAADAKLAAQVRLRLFLRWPDIFLSLPSFA